MDLLEWYNTHQSTDRLKKINEESSNTINFYNTKINNGEYLSYDDLSAYRKAIDDYIDSSNRFREYNKSYGTSYTEEDEKSWNDTISSLQNGYASIAQYYSQFGSKIDMDEFNLGWTGDDKPTAESVAARQNYYEANKQRIASLEKDLNFTAGSWLPNFVENIFLSKEDEALRDELEGLRKSNERYEALQKDLDTYYTPDTEKYLQSASLGWEKYLADVEAAEAKKQEEENAPWWLKALSEAGRSADTTFPMSGVTQTITDLRENDSYKLPNDNWSAEQKQMFGHLYNNDTDAAFKYAIETNNKINTEKEEAALQDISKMSTSGFWAGAGNTLGAIASAITGGADLLYDMAQMQAWGTTMSDGTVSPFEYSQAVTEGISTKLNEMGGTLDESIPIIGGKGWGDVYGLGVEIAKSWASKPLGGTGTLISYFGQGAASSFDDAKKRGASDEQALLYGVSAGLFEGIAEKYSIESLLSAKTTGHFFKDFLKSFGNQFLAEGQEEGLTSLLTNIADNIIMQDKSNFNALVKQYIAQGMDESEAKKMAWVKSAEGILFDTIAGGVSGGTSGGMQATINHGVFNYQTKQDGQNLINKGGVAPLQALALEMHGVSKDVDNYSAKVTEEASAKNVGKLAYFMENSITEQNRAEIQNALVKKGLSKKDAMRVSDYLSTFRNLTEEQIKEVKENEKIKAVVEEVLGDPSNALNERTKSLMAARLGITYKGNLSADNVKKGKSSVLAKVDIKDKISKDGTNTMTDNTGKAVAVTIDKKDPIAKVEVKDGKRTVYLNTDKGKVDSAKVSYANETEALLYESFVDLTPAVANAIIKNYDGKTPVQSYINGMREGVVLYGMHNFQGVGKDISSKGFFASLSEADQANALRIGKGYASSVANRAEGQLRKVFKDAEVQAKASENTSKKMHKEGKVSFEEGARIESDKEDKAERRAEIKEKSRAISLAKVLAKATGINIVFYDARTTKFAKGKKANGFFDADTNTIHLDLQNANDDNKTIAYTLSHELVHFIKEWSPAKFNTLAKFLMEQYAEHGINSETLLANKMAELKMKPNEAFEEMVADACERMLLDSNAVVKLMELRKQDLDLFEKIKLHILKILTSLRDMYKKYEGTLSDEAKALESMTDVLEQMYSLFEEATVQAVENYQAAESLADLEANTDVIPVESSVKFSYKSLAKAAGFDAIENEDGSRSFIRDGKAVNEVTVEDIENSPIGAFINYSLDKKDITKEQADAQKKMFADICTLSCKTNDFSMTMQFVGSEIFTAMKANADKQYGTTYDMPSICTKTQAVIDAMSARMVKLGRGLTTEEITAIYNEVNHAGNPVPCPECYVFSRWIGIGGLLNNIKQYQDYYGKMSVTEVAEAYKKLRAEVEAKAEELEISFGKAKGKLTKKYTDEFNKLTEKIEKQDNQGEKVKESDRKKLKELESMMNTVKAMTWIENVYFADSALTKVNKNFKVPDDVLFDLNKGEIFASQYKAAWAFRTTQGAGYGKAITPYAEVSLGEGILVTNNTSNAIKGKANGTLNNYFLSQNGKMDANARKALDRARLKQKIQAFLGGQRFQSTSDARYENASDYLLAALEMQAMHGMVQVYTKVDGAVPAFENWGFSSNQSLMPMGGGLDADGNVKDTSVGGMNPKVAIANRNKYEHAGTITIGVNDNHIRALYALSYRDFIIPYHASGGKADVVAEFRRIQEGQEKRGKMVRSTDYSRTQSDKVLSDEVLKWLGKTDAEIEQIHKVREARIGILTRGKVDMEVVRGNRFLSALYDKFNGGVWDEVKIAKGKVESQIFPNEFWDESVTYEESGKITADYLEYCNDLGFLHRFSGLVPSNGMLVPVKGYDENGERVTLTDLAFKYENGQRTNKPEDFYWKLITDRRMYGHNGQYLPQKIVTLNDTTTDTVTTFAKNNDGRQYNKELSLATANKVADETWGNIVEEVGAENIPEATELYTDVENTKRIKTQKKKTSDNTYENIGKELMYYEEGDLAPDLTLVETVNDRTGKTETTIKHHGQKPKNYVPKKIAYCYKLFEQHPDGTLHALFAGASNAVPIGEWKYAQGFPRNDAGVKGMNLRERYGWHLSAGLPSAPHLMSSKYFERGYPSKNSYGHPKGSKRVWVRMAYDASTDFNSIADSTGKENDIYGLIPFGGYYAFKENNQSEWVISSAVKIDKILDEKERQQILKDAGYDEYEAWRLKYKPTPEEKAARELASKERQKARVRAKKLGIDTELTESTKAMRDAIKSRIIDNPELTSNIKMQAKKVEIAEEKLTADSIASDFVTHMNDLVKSRGEWYTEDVFKYVEKYPEINFIDRIYEKDSEVKKDLNAFLNTISDVKVLHYLSWYMGEAYGDKNRTWSSWDSTASFPYRGAVRTFRNAIKKRTNAVITEQVEGTNLGVKNGDVSLTDIKDMFYRLNSNDEIGKFAEKVFVAADKLGVNIRFANQVFSKHKVAGDNLGDMVEYKTSYFNDTAYSDQGKASTILHELIHACTLYILDANKYLMGDVYYTGKSKNYENISNAATRLNRIYEEIKNDSAFVGKYGIKNVKEMVAELANEDFVGLLKEKNIWEKIVEWVCSLFGINRGTSAYDNARLCVDYILDNPEISEYKEYASETRSRASRGGYDVFGSTITDNIKMQAKKNTEKILMGSLFSGGGTLEAGLTYQMLDKQFGVEYDGKIASVYADNHGDHIQVGKVEDFDISKYDDIFYLHASPVCHNFSKAKHGATELQMDIDSAKATATHLETAMPQVFTVENAPGYRKSQSLKIITDKLTELGYKWDVDVYNSADYGSATSRNRVILRAVKEGELPPKPTKQERTNSWDKVTRDLWDTLPKSYLRPSFISAIENTPKLPILDATGKVKVDKPLLILTTTSGHTVTYCWEGEICPTLTTKCGEAKLVMPDGNIYAVTPEFMGRIQGLPNDYKYPKEKTRAFTIIGNGIPTHLTKAVVGGVLDSAYEQTHDGRILYQKKKLSNRTILANALESTIDSSTQEGQYELKKLKEYKEKIDLIEKEEARLAEIKAEIHDISFTKGSDRSKLSSLNDEKIMTQNRINTYDRQLTRLESMKPIKNVLEREKELVRKRTEEKGREALEAYKQKVAKVQKEQIGQMRVAKKQAVAKVRESRDKQEARQKLNKLVLETISWMTHPAKTDVRCPDMLKAPYKEFLDSINLDSKRALNGGQLTKNDLRIDSAMNSLASVIEKIRDEQVTGEGDVSGFLDLPENFVKVLRDMAEDIKKIMVGGYFVVNSMTSDEVNTLTRLIRILNSSIKKMNTLHANFRFANAQMLGDASIGFLDSMGEAEKTNSVKDFVAWDNALPYYAFKKFGEGGESIFEELMDAQDKMAFNAKRILDFTEKAWTDKEAKEWGEDTHTILLPSGGSLTLTTADAMGIYCLSRRDNGTGINHLTGGGVRVVGLTKGSTKAKDSRANLTLVDIEEIIDSLTDRQKAVAEAIQEFMSTECAEWGNEISMKRFLTKDFTEKVYYPVESDNENLNTELPQASQNDLYRLLNISATKSLTKGANNRVIIRNIFDVFTAHSSDMARLNAYGMAILDYMKWLNYRERNVDPDNGQIKTRGVRQSMNSTYGDAATKYVMTLIRDINGRAGDVGSHPWLSKMARMAKTASVAGNVRVMLLQITAYPRAAMVLPVDSLAKGLMKLPQIEKTKKYSGIALWKSFGFFDTNIARSIEDQIKGTKDIRSKLIELSMKGAEYADAITWGCLWNACEYEVAKTTKNKVGSEEFYQEVGKKLREVVYATQVVDSVLTRSQLMRNKDGLTQMATAYMSEPTLTANILMNAFFQFVKAKRIGLPTVDAWKNLGKTIGVYVSVAVFTTLMESLSDAFRDDDEDENFGEKFASAILPNLVSNVIPFNKLPIIADISDAVQSLFGGGKYYSTEIMSSQWLTQSIYAINAWKSVLSGKNTPTTVYDALFKSMKAISFITGLPISNVMRDLVAMWNTIIGSINEDLIID